MPKTVAISATLLLLAGCSEVFEPPPTPEEVVAERAQARWDALIAGDWEKAYSFASPSFRAVADLDRFRMKLGDGGGWQGAEVKKVECEADVCQATVGIKFKPPFQMRNAFEQPLETHYRERWILEDENWWIFIKP
jgi:hypothetical protein